MYIHGYPGWILTYRVEECSVRYGELKRQSTDAAT